MLKNDQNPEKGGGEGADLLNDLNAEIPQEELDQHDGKDSDPLDAIADETARNQAKKDRAISRRIAKAKANSSQKVTPPQGGDDEDDEDEEDDEEEEVTLPKNVATKDDLKTIATNGAKKLVPQEVLDVWDELAAVPLGGFKPLDEQSIAENYIKRYNLYILDHPGDAENPATPLTASSIQRAGGSKKVAPKQEGERDLPGLKEPVPPEDWYPEKKD